MAVNRLELDMTELFTVGIEGVHHLHQGGPRKVVASELRTKEGKKLAEGTEPSGREGRGSNTWKISRAGLRVPCLK